MSRELLLESSKIVSFDILECAKQLFIFNEFPTYVEFVYSAELTKYIANAIKREAEYSEKESVKSKRKRKHEEFIKQVTDCSDLNGGDFYRKE